MANLLKQMQAENESRQTALAREDSEMLERMMRYLGTTRISRYALEDIRRDLIGMAAEAEEQSHTFAEALGMPEEEFCRQLAEDAQKRTVGEWLAVNLPGGLLMVLVLLCCWLLIQWHGWQYPFTTQTLLFFLFWVPIGTYAVSFMERRWVYAPKAGRVRSNVLRVAAIVVYFLLARFLPNVLLFSLPTLAVFGTVAALLAAAWLYRQWYGRRMAAQYPRAAAKGEGATHG